MNRVSSERIDELSPSPGKLGEGWGEGLRFPHFLSVLSPQSSALIRLRAFVPSCLLCLSLLAGCAHGPIVLSDSAQTVVDRRFMEYPTGFVVKPMVVGLTAPTAICFDTQGNMFVAEGGGTIDAREPHIFGVRLHGSPGQQIFNVYPAGQRIPVVSLVSAGFQIYGPIGGMAAVNGKLYVTHLDAAGRGAVTSFGYDGSHTPVVADLPASGDYKMGDIQADENGRLYFSVGSATNSGVVGLDNWQSGWVLNHPEVCDAPYIALKLQGYRFNSLNPLAGLFSGADIAVTGPYQPFNIGDSLHIPKSPTGKPTGAIYSISPAGGDLRVEAWGVHVARGIACGDFHRVYFTDNGMEPRGTRPVLNDPDAVFQLVSRGSMGAWYGWPDYSRELELVGADKYQPPPYLLRGTGYHEISALLDEQVSGIAPPDRANWLKGIFPSQAGAAGLDIIPTTGNFKDFRGGLIVALAGDRAPFSTGGENGVHLREPTGYKVVRVDLLTHEVTPFVHNVRLGPASELGQAGQGLERPVAVKFGPDGSLYILDYGHMRMKQGNQDATAGSGRIWRLMPG